MGHWPGLTQCVLFIGRLERECALRLRGVVLWQMAARSMSWVTRTSLAAVVVAGVMRNKQPYSFGGCRQITARKVRLVMFPVWLILSWCISRVVSIEWCRFRNVASFYSDFSSPAWSAIGYLAGLVGVACWGSLPCWGTKGPFWSRDRDGGSERALL
jgi:hypothetical protein